MGGISQNEAIQEPPELSKIDITRKLAGNDWSLSSRSLIVKFASEVGIVVPPILLQTEVSRESDGAIRQYVQEKATELLSQYALDK